MMFELGLSILLVLRATTSQAEDFTVDALSDPPADVTNFTKNLSGGTLFLTWSPVADLDLSYYQIKRFPGTTGGSWATSNVVVEKVARPGTSVAINRASPGRISYVHMIRAVTQARTQPL